MKKNITLLFLFFLISPFISFAQNDTISNDKNKLSIPDIEKVYLHTDRNYYTVGESIWYKAYSVYAYNNLLFDNSKILYVELISPESKIITRNITRLEGGLGSGDFTLADSLNIKPGTYQLRAYSNWTRNFGDDFVFKKEIQIIDTATENTQASKENTPLINPLKDKNNKATSSSETINNVRIDFFPEGGSLIENVSSNLAFKATDSFGYPIEITGILMDDTGKSITKFKSSHDGMGKFLMLPEKNHHYYAMVTTPNNDEIKVAIPEVQKTGYSLSMNVINDKKVITIYTNQETLNENPNAELTLVCSTRGITYYDGALALNQTKFSFILPEDELPEGITQMTLYDNQAKPLSERLVYIAKNNSTDVTISSDKPQYNPNEKVNLKISAKDKQGNPLQASFSISATDTNGLNNDSNEANICSYFLMAADIKGKINNPNYYFNTSNPERLAHLDLLLLTQGWRDFLWKKIPTLKETPDFKLEKELKVSGIVKELLGKSPKENSRVSLMLMNGDKSLFLQQTTDKNGKFEFDNISFTGRSSMILNTQNEQGKNKGMFVLDSIYSEPMTIDFKEPNFQNSQKLKADELKENIHNKNLLFNIPEENQLKSVVITAQKKAKDTGPSLYGFSDYSYVPDEKGNHYSSLYMLIQVEIPGVTVTESENSIRFNRNSGNAIVIVDGVEETDGSFLSSISTDNIAKIEAIKGPGAAVFGSKGINGAILIYTKGGKGATSNQKNYQTIAKLINGFQNTRLFYSPDYSDPKSLKNKAPDIRNTLYWNPYVQPDEKGEKTLSFYNSDANTSINVSMEGITTTGIPVVVETKYTIKK